MRKIPLATATATAAADPAATTATAARECCATMASLRVLAFDHEGRLVAFDTWLDDLQLYLLSDIKDSFSLFDHVSGATTAPPTTADGATRSQWLSRDAAARIAICNHLPVAECTHFGQHRTAQALYDAVVARYSSPATAALGRLLLPYLFPEQSAFATVANLVTHLRTSNARYCAAVPAEDHFLSLDPTSLTVNLLEQHLLAAKTSAVAVGAPRGTPRLPFFEGCSSSPLAPSFTSAAAVDVSVAEDVGAASTSAKRRTSKGKGGRGGGGGSGGGGGGSGSGGGVGGGGGGASQGGGGGGTGGGSGGSGSGGGGSGGSGGSGGGGTGGSRSGPRRGGPGGGPRQFGVAIVDLDYDVTMFAMYALSVSAEGDCYRCVPPDPGIAAAALGASESGTLPGPDVARSSTVLPCPAVPSGSLSGLHLPSFSSKLVSTAALQDAMVTTTTPGGQRVTICTCTRTGRHLATFTRRLGSSPYTLATEPPQVAASAHVSLLGQVAASCSCCLVSHQTLLWHHRLGHPSLPRLCGMHSRLLVSGLPRSLPPLPPSPAPPCLPCVEGRQRAAPHSSSFPPTTAPLETLHMDVWGPARVSGQGRKRYFLLVVDDYTRYTTVFPLRSKGEVDDVLIPWIRTVRLQHRERFSQNLPALRLHSDRVGEFSSDLLRDFCRGEGIVQSFTLPESPQQNGIAERRIGLVMELNLCPRVSLPETSPTLRCTGKDGDASVFRDVTFDESVHFYRLFPYRSAPPLPPPLFLAPVPALVDPLPPPVDPLPPQGPAPSGVSQVDPLFGTAPVQVAVGSGATPGSASGGAASGGAEPRGAGSQGAGSGGAGPGGEEPGGAELEGVEPGGAESEGAESGGATPRGAASSRGPAGASPRLSSQQVREWLVRCAHCRSGAPGAGGAGDTGAGAAGTGGVWGARAGDPTKLGAAGVRGAGAGGAGVGGPGTGGAGAAGAGVGGTGAGGARAAGVGAVDPGAGGVGGTVRPRPYFVPLLQQVLGVPSSTGLTPPFLCPPPDQSQPPLQPASPLPAPSPYTKKSDGLTEPREPVSRHVSPVCSARRVPRSRLPLVPETHAMALRPSSVPFRVPLSAPPESSLPEVPDPESDRACAASPIVSRLLANAVTGPSFESAAASALVVELLDFAAACRLDYATALVAESASASPPSVGGECALGTDVLEDRQEDFECLAAAVPRFASMQIAPEGDSDAPDIPTPRSYAEAITGPYSSQWVKRPPGSLPAFKARYVARGFSQRQGVDYFQTFSPTPKMTTLWVLLHVAAQRDYELHSQDFSTVFLQGSLHEEIWLRRPPGFTGLFPAGTQWSLRRPVYGFRQAPREWHDTLRTALAALGFTPSTADPSLFLRTDTSLPPFYALVFVDDLVFATADTEALTLVKSELQNRHTCSDPGPSALRLPVLLATAHSSVYQPLALRSTFARVRRAKCTSGMGLVLEGRGPVVLIGHADASWVDDSAMQRSSQGYTFSLGSGSVSWRSTRSSSVLSSSCEAEIYAEARAAPELRWLTYLVTGLGEQPRSPPVLYVDNKANIALCQEHRLEHRTKHNALRYFLARELQQCGQLRLAYVATRANTADVFTKALPP
ncbi:unnamed protein product, partial [Closterium sp. NIES-54]